MRFFTRYNFVLVLATDSRCHLAVASNAIRLYHEQQNFRRLELYISTTDALEIDLFFIIGIPFNHVSINSAR